MAATGAAGVRRKGDDTPVTVDDKFHIGSCSKSFTATLAAALVEEGVIGWDTTAGEALKKLRPHRGFEDATLAQFLSNTGGFPKKAPPEIKAETWEAKGNPTRQRRDYLRAMLRRPPENPPGRAYEYSNTGFAAAGYMLEEAAGKSWEELVDERIFKPLGMASAGFGPPASPRQRRRPDQPWGHRGAGAEPVPPGDPGADNPPAIAPAGAIHCSLPDLAKYVAFHLRREPGAILKKKESFTRLHTPVLDNYALGWIVSDRQPWARGPALTHLGSNTTFSTLIWAAPGRDAAFILAANAGSEQAAETLNQLTLQLIRRFLRD